METINLEPNYTIKEIPGKCLKCLAEKELNDCLIELLGKDVNNSALQQRYEALEAFLQSSESQKLREESEKYLSEGKHVKVKVNFTDGKLQCELEIN